MLFCHIYCCWGEKTVPANHSPGPRKPEPGGGQENPLRLCSLRVNGGWKGRILRSGCVLCVLVYALFHAMSFRCFFFRIDVISHDKRVCCLWRGFWESFFRRVLVCIVSLDFFSAREVSFLRTRNIDLQHTIYSKFQTSSMNDVRILLNAFAIGLNMFGFDVNFIADLLTHKAIFSRWRDCQKKW